MRTTIKAVLGAAAIALVATGGALADAEENPGVKSGYDFAEPETRTIQDDDFDNPAFMWVETAETLWTAEDGEYGYSCESCHGDPDSSMTAAAARYPVYDKGRGKPVNIEQRINQCRVNNMKAKAWKYESDELLGMTAYVKMFSRGFPVDVKVDGEMKPFFEKGKEFYFQRRGMYDLACKHCHEEAAGNYIRAELLSQGQSNGFPTFRLKWQKLGSLHRRFRGCNKNIRSEPYPYGADEYVNLELFLAWRGRGLPVESPSVRK